MTVDWHVYRMDWSPDALIFSIDGQETGRITERVPSMPMVLILNLAVGANGHRATSQTPDTLAMDIDYVRVTAHLPDGDKDM